MAQAARKADAPFVLRDKRRIDRAGRHGYEVSGEADMAHVQTLVAFFGH